LQASGTGGSVIFGASDSNDIIEKITSGLSNMLFNIRPTVLPGCAASISFTPEVTSSVGVAKVGAFVSLREAQSKSEACASCCLQLVMAVEEKKMTGVGSTSANLAH
jgi:hypothetical protein